MISKINLKCFNHKFVSKFCVKMAVLSGRISTPSEEYLLTPTFKRLVPSIGVRGSLHFMCLMYMKSNRSFAVAVLPRSESPALLEDEEELQWKNKFSHFTVTVF